MDPIRNPYAPGAGTPPPELAGRDDIRAQARIALGRAKVGRPTKSMLVVGLRGVGKTVLLDAIRQDAESEGIQTLWVEAPEDRSLPSIIVPQLPARIAPTLPLQHQSRSATGATWVDSISRGL